MSITEPKPRQVTVHFGGSGKVALQGFGKESSEYGINISRTYDVPSTWSDDEVKAFELETFLKIQEVVEPLIENEHTARMNEQERRIIAGEFE